MRIRHALSMRHSLVALKEKSQMKLLFDKNTSFAHSVRMQAHSGKKKGIFIAVIVLLLVVLVLSIKLFLLWQRRVQSITSARISPAVLPTRIDTGDGSYATMTTIPNQMKFVSPKLWISFLYGETTGVPKILTKEEGDKVYIYADYHYPGFDYHKDAPYVQVFQKDPQDDLATSIKKTILKGYSQSNCFIQTPARNVPGNSLYQTASINFPRSNSPTQTMINAAKCPFPYTQISGEFYFAVDKNHPERFVFFDIGTSNFAATSLGTWNETLHFLP